MYDKFNCNAYKQAYVISNYLVNKGEIVIPQELLDIMEKRMNKKYYFDLNDIKKVEILPDTEKILTIIYLDCVVSQKEKEKICELTKKIRSIVSKDDEEQLETGLISADLSGLKFWEKLKIKFNKLLVFHQS